LLQLETTGLRTSNEAKFFRGLRVMLNEKEEQRLQL